MKEKKQKVAIKTPYFPDRKFLDPWYPAKIKKKKVMV